MKLPLRRKVGHAAKLFDAVVDCAHFNLPPHPRRIKTTAPLTRVTPDRFARVAQRKSDSDASLGSGLRRWELAIDSRGLTPRGHQPHIDNGVDVVVFLDCLTCAVCPALQA